VKRSFVLGLLASLTLLAAGPQASAEFTTIYSDNFDGGATTLNGRVTPVGSGTWQFNSPTSFAEAYLSNGTMNAGGATAADGRVAALLPFTPQPGNIYRVSGTINATSATQAWAALGFANALEGASGLFAFGNINGNPWMLKGDTGTSALQGFAGPATNNLIVNTFSGNPAQLQIVLDTTEQAWKTTMFANGTERGTYTYVVNPTILGVGFSKGESLAGNLSGFSLEVQPVPEPSSLALAGLGAVVAGVVCGRRGLRSRRRVTQEAAAAGHAGSR
jgi:hypothetical protein